MDYISTRNKERKVSAAYAIANGIAPDGGLYCPTAFPALTDADWKTLAESDYKGRSALILGKFLTDFTAEELAENPRARSAKLRVAERCGFDIG